MRVDGISESLQSLELVERCIDEHKCLHCGTFCGQGPKSRDGASTRRKIDLKRTKRSVKVKLQEEEYKKKRET